MRRWLFILMSLSVLFGLDIEYELSRGWNMISVPCHDGVTELDSIFPIVPPGYTYNPGTMSYSAVTEVPEPNVGMFILCTTDTTITLECADEIPETVVVSDTFYTEEPFFCKGITASGMDTAAAVAFLNDGSAVVAGRSTGDSLYPSVMFVAIFPADDGPVVIKTIGWMNIQALAPASDGGFFIACRTMTAIGDIFVMKMTSGGDIVWGRCYTDPAVFEIRDLEGTSSGGVLILTGAGVIKLDSSGNQVFGKTLEIMGFDIMESTGGGVVVAGVYVRGAESSAMAAVKLNGSGGLTDAIEIGSSLELGYEDAALTDDGDIIVSGSTRAAASQAPVITKLSFDSGVIWSRRLDISGRGLATAMLSDGLYGLVGYSDTGGFFAMFTDSGLESAGSYSNTLVMEGDRESLTGITATDDGCFISGIKENFGLLTHIVLMRTDEVGYSCCGSEMTTDFEPLTTSSSVLDLTTFDFAPSMADSILTLNPGGEIVGTIYYCPR